VSLVSTTAELALAELAAFSSRDAMIDELVRRGAQSLGIEAPSWSWTTSTRGSASWSTHTIKLPTRLGSDDCRPYDVQQRTRLYLAYYVLHELAHLPRDSYGHAAAFKAYERAVLADVLSVSVRYQRVYPASLSDVESRVELYVAVTEKLRRARVEQRRRRRAAHAAVEERWAAGQADR
jgi:hypothetical protein